MTMTMPPMPPPDPFEPPGPWQRKVWGWTRMAVSSSVYQRHELYVERGHCSVHYHEERANHFRVLSGRIAVRTWEGLTPDSPGRRYVLLNGMTLDIPSLMLHQFEVLVPGQVIEEYWPDRGGTVRVDDIVRLREGSGDALA